MKTEVFPAAVRSASNRERFAELYGDASIPLSDLIHIEDPAFYVDPWPAYDRLHEEAPVYFYEPFNTWILTKHEDVQFASRHSEIFSVKHGILLYDGMKKESGLGELFAGRGDMIGHTDPPRHGELRRIMQPPFTPPALADLHARLDAFCDDALGKIVPGEPFDWVANVASRLPIVVISSILGLPTDEDVHQQVRVWADAVEELASRDVTPERFAEIVESFKSLTSFIHEIFDQKRANPGDDFLSSLLGDHLDDEKLSDANLIGFAQLLIAAGVDTSRALLSEMVAHLAAYPDQREILRRDLTLVPNAIEEVLRFAPPAKGFGRQVVADHTMRGQDMITGQRIYVSYEAANRDPDVFENPHQFDIQRSSNRKNVAFGFGSHVCIAAPLVRLETKILLEKLMTRFPRFELAEGGRRVESFLRNSWVELPIVFHED